MWFLLCGTVREAWVKATGREVTSHTGKRTDRDRTKENCPGGWQCSLITQGTSGSIIKTTEFRCVHLTVQVCLEKQ
jgi:hypothetical protein